MSTDAPITDAPSRAAPNSAAPGRSAPNSAASPSAPNSAAPTSATPGLPTRGVASAFRSIPSDNRAEARLNSGVPAPQIYFASTSHRRNSNAPGAVTRTFSYTTCYWLVDVDDLPVLPRPLRPFARFESRDHLGDADAGLADNARAALAENGLQADRILLLTCPRVAGHVFNPLSVFYCFATRADERAPNVTGGERVNELSRAVEVDRRGQAPRAGRDPRREAPLAGGDPRGEAPLAGGDPRGEAPLELIAVIAEVHNTYGGRHVYLLRPDVSGKDTVGKEFYVSPFLPMGGTYLMRTPVPGENLSVSIALRQNDETPFVATLTGRGRPISTRSAVAALLRWPLLTLRTAALIRWQGIRLWLRKVPVQPRPPDATARQRG